MTSRTLYVKDNYINTTIYDDSTVIPTDPIMPKRLTLLQPIFASEGKANVILDFSSSSLVKSTYGSDMEDLKKYGQGGINLIHMMGGGASAQVCRLLPEDAEVATCLVSLELKESSDITVYTRDATGAYALDEHGDKIPEQIDNPEYTGPEDLEHPEKIDKKISGIVVTVKVDKGDPSSDVDGKANVSGDEGEMVWSIPLYKLVYNGAGKCGNNIGHSVENDFQRDDAVTDGRRYIMTLYKKDNDGNVATYGDQFYFSLNPNAVLVPGTEVYENLKYVFTDKTTNGMPRAVQCKPYIMDNYDILHGAIAKYCGDTSPYDIDILNCLDKNGNPYDEFVLSEEPDNIDFTDSIFYLQGGSDGSLQEGYTFSGGDKDGQTVSAEDVENTKKALLVSFFEGHIDPCLLDERMVTSDIVLDANYDFEKVKPAMLGKFRDLRPDIMVIADIGDTCSNCTQALNLVKSVYGMVDGSGAYSAAVIIHAGNTTDRALPIHVTATYDYGYGMAKCYGQYGTFSVFAGYQQAKVTTMEFDWLPYKDEYDTMIGPLRKAGCIFAFAIDRKGTVAYMAEENMYVQTTSRLKSIRNSMVIGDAVRMAKAILIKYVYDNEGAAGSIRKATDEMQQTIVGRYPDNIIVSPLMYQSTRDKMMDSTTCDLTYKFPGMTKEWTLNIYAKRDDA